MKSALLEDDVEVTVDGRTTIGEPVDVYGSVDNM